MGVRGAVDGRSCYIVTRSRVHFAACIDPVVFFFLNAVTLRDFLQFTVPFKNTITYIMFL